MWIFYKIKNKNAFLSLSFLFFSFSQILLSQESTKNYSLTLKEAEETFLKNNLRLLAAKFEIDVKKAGIIQAKLYANPNISVDQNIFNDNTQRYFDTTRNGQTTLQIQQLFLLGGKIEKRTKVAEINKAISEQQFFDLLRALKFELRSSFFGIHYLRQSIQFYDGSIAALTKTVSSLEKAYEKRAVLQSEMLRLKALLFFLENERTEAVVQVKQKEASLRILLNSPELMNVTFIPKIDSKGLEEVRLTDLKLDKVINDAFENRPDLKIAIQALKLEEANLALQQANAVPDLSFGPMYNRNGTAYPNYWGVTAQLTVPIFDRNQGNIEAAEKAILTRRSELQNQKLQAENEVTIIYNRLLEKDRLYQAFKNRLTEDYTNLAQLMISNYEKRYLTVIEFADFFETYRTSVQQMLKLQIDRVDSIENLNYSVGKSILNIQPNE
ncbi:MAG TPA: TolC family protein [Leptospiraceae bacterium]|nr:TolC family protein [Leptospiraceae bacterium]HMX30769.1 TolC family protein [Leptospiraceae bacterium]HMY31764.1 TolC family protein [Leptospiraceae bacterium]HMZ63095.1 TolC family protein [Leptospiraceae bacterium]HNA07703.1 TolC family protein [Leptospiraceae bacterium]